MSAEAIRTSIAQRFHALRRRYLLLQILTWCCSVLTILLAVWLLVAACDYFLEVSIGYRRALIGVVVLVISAIAVPSFISVLRRSQKMRFARLLEESFHEFGQRLRTILDVLAGRVDGPNAMITALANQTLARWETTPLHQILPMKWFIGIAGALAALLCGVLVISSVSGDWNTAMWRAAGKDVAYTNWSVFPGTTQILEGTDALARIALVGRPDREVQIRYRSLDKTESEASADWIEANLVASDDISSGVRDYNTKSYGFNFGKMARDVEYQFKTSVGTTPLYTMSMQPLIRVTSVQVATRAPAYTQLDERVYDSSDVTVLENSTVVVTIETNHRLETVTLESGYSKSQMSQSEQPKRGEGNRWVFELPTTQSLFWSFAGADLTGVPMDPLQGRLRVRSDTEPKLYWRSPADGFEAHKLAEIPMNVVASDDYGLDKIGIVFQLGEEEFELKQWSAVETPNPDNFPDTKVTLESALPLESFQLTEHEYVGYYAYAVDNREGEPLRIETDIRYIDIRPLRQKYGLANIDPDAVPGDGRRRSLLQPLQEIIRRQRFVINRTRKFSQTLPNETSLQLNTVDRLVENQSELASLVRFLAGELANIGTDRLEALSKAETSMLQAADSLSAGEFKLAFTQENDALKSLVEARDILEVLVSNNAQMREMRMMRDIARRLSQKLRLDRPKSEIQIADTLEALAREQAQMTESVRTMLATAKTAQEEINGSDKPDDAGSNENQEETTDANTTLATEDRLKKEQFDLHDRFAEVAGDLEEQSEKSKLLAERIKGATAKYDSIERENDWNEFFGQSEELTSLLVETAIQLRNIAPEEPVSRISELRSIAVALGNFERQTASELQRPSEDDELSEESTAAINQLISKAVFRAETALDAIELPVDVGDVETSEVNDHLAQLNEQTKLEDLLQNSISNLRSLSDGAKLSNSDRKAEAEEAKNRSNEFAEAAQLLSDLYEQLMTPKLDQLRRLEVQATELANLMNEGEASEAEAQERRINEELQDLEKNLRESSLEELIDLLKPSDVIGGNGEEQTSTQVNFESDTAGVNQGKHGSRHVQSLVFALRNRIQQMIMLEISPERDLPVPEKYRQAVDRYFQRIAAGSNDADKEMP